MAEQAAMPTRAQKVILAACAEKGLTVTEMWWEPWGQANEMEGMSGGWTVEFGNSDDGPAVGLNAQETADYIRSFVARSAGGES